MHLSRHRTPVEATQRGRRGRGAKFPDGAKRDVAIARRIGAHTVVAGRRALALACAVTSSSACLDAPCPAPFRVDPDDAPAVGFVGAASRTSDAGCEPIDATIEVARVPDGDGVPVDPIRAFVAAVDVAAFPSSDGRFEASLEPGVHVVCLREDFGGNAQNLLQCGAVDLSRGGVFVVDVAAAGGAAPVLSLAQDGAELAVTGALVYTFIDACASVRAVIAGCAGDAAAEAFFDDCFAVADGDNACTRRAERPKRQYYECLRDTVACSPDAPGYAFDAACVVPSC